MAYALSDFQKDLSRLQATANAAERITHNPSVELRGNLPIGTRGRMLEMRECLDSFIDNVEGRSQAAVRRMVAHTF